MMPTEGNFQNCLKPHIRGEAISLKEAAQIAGRSESTIRSWCNQRGVGRRIAGGKWDVSRIALAMLLDGDEEALGAYLSGERLSALVKPYFDRYGVSIPTIFAKSTTFAKSAVSPGCA